MFETSMQVTLTDFAMKRTGKLHGERFTTRIFFECISTYMFPAEHEPKMWDNLKGQFVNHIDQINADLKAAGLPALGADEQGLVLSGE